MFFCLAVPGAAPPWKLPPLREQARIRQEWLKARLEQKLQPLMHKHGVAMWLVICREYNEDPVSFSLVSPTTMAARHRTIYVFYDRGGESGVERLALGGSSNGSLYTVYRDPEQKGRELMGDSQWATLRRLIEERRPASIGVNISATHASSDGLSASEYLQLETALGPGWLKRVVHAEGLPLEDIGARLPEMLPVYQGMMQVVHWLIARAFSNEVIQPGKTTSQDVVWWLRQQKQNLGYATWFHPSVRVQKPAGSSVDLLSEDAPVVTERGDILHFDYGLTALGLNTDTQHMRYVLKQGEAAAPPGIVAALNQARRFQDLVLAELQAGHSGNQVLAGSLARHS